MVITNPNVEIERLRSEICYLVECCAKLHEALNRVKETGVFVGAIAQQMMDEALDLFEKRFAEEVNE